MMKTRFGLIGLLLLIWIGLFVSQSTIAPAVPRGGIFKVDAPVFTPTPFMADGTVEIENDAEVPVTVESVEVIISAAPEGGAFTPIPSSTTFTGPAANPSLAPGVVIPPETKITFSFESGYVAPPDTEEINIEIQVALEGVPEVFVGSDEEDVVPAPFPPTSVSGTVVTGNQPRPLPGVTVCIAPDGRSCFVEVEPGVLAPTAISTTTDPAGSFTLNVPDPGQLGSQRLLFDGSTVDPPLGTFASLLDPAFPIVPGANSTGTVPLVAVDSSRAVSVAEGVQSTSTMVESSPATDAGPATGSPVMLEVSTGTNVSFPMGATPQISISQVPLDQLPMPFAPGTFSPLVFTLQPGGTTLDPPAPITIPNPFPGLPDGTVVDIFGLDTSQGGTGSFIDIGDGVVTNGGTQIQSIGGVVSFFAWYYCAPQIPPPTTVVDGLVVDGNGTPVVGASVMAMGFPGTTVGPPVDTNGNGQVENFWISDVPATDPITVVASLTVDGVTLTGFSAPTPPTPPKTEVGPIVLAVPLLLSPSSLTITPGDTDILTVSIPFPTPAGVTVFLVSANPGVADVTSSTFIPAGATSASATVTGVGPGTTTITASAAGFTDATATVTVPPLASPLSLSPSSLDVPQGGTRNLTVGLPFPAPAGGVIVSLVSANPGVATVTPSVVIPAGATSASATVTGVGPGTTDITASAPGFTSATATVNVTGPPPLFFLTLSPSPLFVPQGATATLTVMLSSPAPAGGVTVSLVSANPGVATVTPSVVIPIGTTSATVAVNGVAAGTTNLTASDPIFGSATATVNVTGPPSATLLLFPSPLAVPEGTTGNMTVGIPFPALADVTVFLESANPGVATVTPSVVIPIGTTSATVAVNGVAAGTTTITAFAPGFADATATVNVTAPLPTPSIFLSPSPLDVLQGTTRNLTVNLPSPAPAGGVTVSLVSANPGVATLPPSVFIPAGTLSATVAVNGVAAGTTTITASAPGFESSTVTVNVIPPPPLSLSSSPLDVPQGTTDSLTVGIPSPAPAGGVLVILTSAPAGIVTIPPTVTIPEGATSAPFNVTAVGTAGTTATITASSPGFTPATATVNVTAPFLFLRMVVVTN
ncbi:MAG: hypothetical protein ACE5JQ_03460 [Candidatus Methylomirabilales bacterium]